MLVLAAMALIAFLALAIMTFVRSEDRNSRAAADLVEVRLLADLPEKLVISQVRRATANLDAKYTWASQPGVIRVFGISNENGKPRSDTSAIYKLYSSEDMVLIGDGARKSLSEEAEEISAVNWAADATAEAPITTGAVYADLNEPAVVQPVQRQRDKPDFKKGAFIYPIIDPAAIKQVDGFTVDENAAPKRTIAHTFPMPARWIYVLRDGSLCVADGSNPENIRLKSTTGDANSEPTEDNPVVGRIAFWTDDEGCKLNINTASEPAPWDTPHTRSKTDEDYAQAIPAKGEYYRLSGHPAFTSVAPALRFMSTAASTGGSPIDAPIAREPQPLLNSGPWAKHIEDWHALFPRSPLPGGGTLGGTLTNTSEAVLKQQRLFASVDELFYASGDESTEQRPRNGIGGTGPQFTEDKLRATQFFLTTRSRSPELNPFNRPKISLWPVPDAIGERNQIDNRMVRASTIGQHGYYFTRATNTGASAGSSQSQTDDINLPRNGTLITSLTSMATTPLPGLGVPFVGGTGAMMGKYVPDAIDQLATSSFDLIRWGINPATPVNPQPTTEVIAPTYTYLPPSSATPQMPGAWSAVPTLGLGKGTGLFPTITEVALVLTAADVERDLTTKLPVWDTTHPEFAKQTTKIAAFLVLQTYIVSPGPPACSPTYVVEVNAPISINGQPVIPVGALPNRITHSAKGSTAYTGFTSQFLTQAGTPKLGGQANDGSQDFEDRAYAFTTVTPVTLPVGKGGPVDTIALSGGLMTVTIKEDATLQTIQSFEIDIPNSTIPVPTLRKSNVNDFMAMTMPGDWTKDRFTPVTKPNEPDRVPNLIYRGDTVLSWVPDTSINPASGLPADPAHGDIRLMASMPQVLRTLFKPSKVTAIFPAGDPEADRYTYSLQDGSGAPLLPKDGAAPLALNKPTEGSLLVRLDSSGLPKVVLHDPKAAPALAPGVLPLNADKRPGDFSNGLGILPDGPFIEMPDANTAINETKAFAGTTSGWFQRGGDFADEDGTSFNPLRQAASGFVFGTLPTGLFGTAWGAAPRPWQTLLLCPNPASRTTAPNTEPGWTPTPPTGGATAIQDHFGFAMPRDHLWLEFFRMPIIEPAGLADSVSTEGKVNMNYQILPYKWIKRATAMHGALQGVRMTAIPSAAVKAGATEHYKDPANPSNLEFRYAVNAPATLEGFEELRFDLDEIFRSPSEITEMWLVPKRLVSDGTVHTYSSGGTITPLAPPGDNRLPSEYQSTKIGDYRGMQTWWENDPAVPDDGFEATGDNLREAPYAQLYPRLATRSNVFTIHYRVQVLRKSRTVKPNEWKEGTDTVVAEQRGSTTIERFLDLNNAASLPDFATTPVTGPTVDDFHQIRVVNRRVFAP